MNKGLKTSIRLQNTYKGIFRQQVGLLFLTFILKENISHIVEGSTDTVGNARNRVQSGNKHQHDMVQIGHIEEGRVIGKSVAERPYAGFFDLEG